MEMCVSRISRATSFRSNDWFEFDESYQVMLPGPGGTDHQDMCEGLKCGKAGGKLQSVLVARLGNRKHGWSTVVHKVQSGKVGCRGNDSL